MSAASICDDITLDLFGVLHRGDQCGPRHWEYIKAEVWIIDVAARYVYE